MNVKLLFLGLSTLLLWSSFSLLSLLSLWGGGDWGFLLLFRGFDTVETFLLISSLEATVTHLG